MNLEEVIEESGIVEQRCQARYAVLCSVVGGAILELPKSLKTGMCCCCREDHSEEYTPGRPR